MLKDFGCVGEVSDLQMPREVLDAPRTSYASIESLCTTERVVSWTRKIRSRQDDCAGGQTA